MQVNRGMVVSSLTKEDANELYPIIGRLEGLAGRSAAQLPEPERIELAEKLKQINAQLIRIAQQRSLEGSSISIWIESSTASS